VFDTRNMNDDEKRRFEILNREREACRLDLQDFENAMKADYNLPAEVGVQPNGVFTLGKARLRATKARPGAPKSRQHKMLSAEVDKLSQLRTAMEKKRAEIERFIFDMRVACDAPHVAKLNADFNWCRPDTAEPYVAVATDPSEDNVDASDDDSDNVIFTSAAEDAIEDAICDEQEEGPFPVGCQVGQ